MCVCVTVTGTGIHTCAVTKNYCIHVDDSFDDDDDYDFSFLFLSNPLAFLHHNLGFSSQRNRITLWLCITKAPKPTRVFFFFSFFFLFVCLDAVLTPFS